MRPAKRLASRRVVRRCGLAALAVGLLTAALAETRAQPAPDESAAVLTADQMLADAMRSGDKSVARRLLSLQFTFADEDGRIHARKDFLADLKGMAAAATSDPKVATYGQLAAVTGERKSEQGKNAFFLDIWAKQKGSWRALTMQNVVLAEAAGIRAFRLDGTDLRYNRPDPYLPDLVVCPPDFEAEVREALAACDAVERA